MTITVSSGNRLSSHYTIILIYILNDVLFSFYNVVSHCKLLCLLYLVNVQFLLVYNLYYITQILRSCLVNFSHASFNSLIASHVKISFQLDHGQANSFDIQPQHHSLHS